MGETLKIYKKQGGFNLVKRYLKTGLFFTAMNQFIVLGKSKTALELLRLSIQLKIKKKLQKEYKTQLLEFDKKYQEKDHKNSDYIWICWLQGIENAPKVVKKCYQSVLDNFPSKRIVLLTENNIKEYVEFPEYILEKYKLGIISRTHFTDLLRLELLIKYGGLWLDSTVLCTMKENKVPEYYFNSDLFLYQNLKPGKNGNSIFVSSWLIYSKTNNKILEATRFLCYEYWKKSNKLIDYYLLHFFLCICLEKYEDQWKKIIPKNNSDPHILLLNFFEKYDEKHWNYLSNEISFHKLSYKLDQNDILKKNTYYKKIIE